MNLNNNFVRSNVTPVLVYTNGTDVSIKTRSPPDLLRLKDYVAQHTTGNWPFFP